MLDHPTEQLLESLGVRILSRLSVGIAVTRDGAIIYANDAFASMMGMDPEQLPGTAHPFLQERHIGVEMLTAIRRDLASGNIEQPLRVRYERGDEFPAWNEVQVFEEGAHRVWMHRDITQQMGAHELWQRYEKLVDASRQFMALVDRSYTYELVNQSFAALFNTEPEAMNGTIAPTVWGNALYESMVEPCLDRCFRGEEVHVQRWLTLPSGARRHLDMVYSPYHDKGGDVQHAVFVAWDNTEEMIATDTVRDLNRALEQRVEDRTAELQDTLQELEAFNYTIAHDLRSPLRFLRSFAHMLEEEAGDRLGDSGRYYCTMISRGVAEMQHLIDRLLDFSRLSRKPVMLEPCDLDAVIASAWETVSVGESMKLDTQPLPRCQGDPSLLKQVFVNLLGNATKFTRGTEDPQAWVYAEASPPDSVQICVRDNGIGFHMTHAEAMFAPFKQIHDQAGNQGSGLGLAIVRRIVERHGGTVWAEGEEGVGASIHVRLNACEIHLEDKPENSGGTIPVSISAP